MANLEIVAVLIAIFSCLWIVSTWTVSMFLKSRELRTVAEQRRYLLQRNIRELIVELGYGDPGTADYMLREALEESIREYRCLS